MRVGVDIDGCIYDWAARAHEASAAAGITNGVTWSSWLMHEDYGVDLQTWLDVLEPVTLDGSLYLGEPMPGAVEALQRLQDEGHSVHLITARGLQSWSSLIRGWTVQWLEKCAVPHDSLSFTKDKSLLRLDALADDAEHNIREATAAGTPSCLIDAQHNSGSDHWWQAANITEFAYDVCSGLPTARPYV